MRLLFVGGSSSGKSLLAQRTAVAISKKTGAPLYYWATMAPTGSEDEIRIARHRRERAGLCFQTVERARELLCSPALPLKKNACVLFDSVTALAANELFGTADTGYFEAPDTLAVRRAEGDVVELSQSVDFFIAVADDVFRCGGKYDALTEEYRRRLAAMLRRLAHEFDGVIEVAAGRTRLHKGGADIAALLDEIKNGGAPESPDCNSEEKA